MSLVKPGEWVVEKFFAFSIFQSFSVASVFSVVKIFICIFIPFASLTV
jgi:hypothetical protein